MDSITQYSFEWMKTGEKNITDGLSTHVTELNTEALLILERFGSQNESQRYCTGNIPDDKVLYFKSEGWNLNIYGMVHIFAIDTLWPRVTW